MIELGPCLNYQISNSNFDPQVRVCQRFFQGDYLNTQKVRSQSRFVIENNFLICRLLIFDRLRRHRTRGFAF